MAKGAADEALAAAARAAQVERARAPKGVLAAAVARSRAPSHSGARSPANLRPPTAVEAVRSLQFQPGSFLLAVLQEAGQEIRFSETGESRSDPSADWSLIITLLDRMYGSGYPGVAGRGVSGRGFPFFFWPIAWGGVAGLGTAAYLHSDEVCSIHIHLASLFS